jgi:propane monooxygenase coupling protein
VTTPTATPPRPSSASPFSADSTASGKCGVTLMNNQIGVVMAEVMRHKEGVTVTPLPSMIRVDAVGRMDFVYAEISEALGEEDDFFDAAQFEENMSTHYGKMIHEDDRTIMFASPEDAAAYMEWDLPTHS